MEWLARTEALIGAQNLDRLGRLSIAVLGLGGVGGACAEALCRAGIGHLILIDHDRFDLTNLNRQLLATADMVGKEKTEAASARFRLIYPGCRITTLNEFYSAENREMLFSLQPDYIIDAIDTVSAKLDLMESCAQRDIPLISCMGTGNRLDPSQFQIGDISETAGCGDGLARVIRKELRKRAVPAQTVLYSTEVPKKVCVGDAAQNHGRHSPASISFTPPVAGYLMAGYVVRSFLQP